MPRSTPTSTIPYRGRLVVALACALLGASLSLAHAAQNDCGQPITGGATPTASDALFVLNAAVGLQACEACVCDTNASGSVTAGDALLTLNVAVGAGGALACEACANAQQLDCEREGYPCSLADADPDALATASALLNAAWDARDAGTMDDARAVVAAHADVVAVGGDERVLRFIVDGAPPVFFDDRTVVEGETDSPPALASGGSASASVSRSESRAAEHALPVGGPGARAVVGEDSTGDGKVDNLDVKRALILAPYEWQFRAFESSKYVVPLLEETAAYQGHITHKRNTAELDTNISLEDFRSFAGYDVVYVSTHGARFCGVFSDDGLCEIVIASGVYTDDLGEPDFTDPGVMIGSHYDPMRNQSRTDRELLLTLDFWRNYYGGSLDNELVNFAACQTGNFEGSELAATLGSDAFVSTGWTETVLTTSQWDTMVPLYEALLKGLTTEQALGVVEDLGRIPTTNPEGFETTLERFAPGGDDVRIVELPRLIYEGSTMPEGVNIVDLVTGTVGDTAPDSIRFTLQVDGVTQDTKSDFEVRYRVDDQDAQGSYGLSSATLVDGFEYRYEVEHDVTLGFPLFGGDVPIEVIVDLPEGGESRFSVTVSLASCSFTARLSGDNNATFNGPAQLQIGDDGSVNIALSSRGWINGELNYAATANFSTGPGNPLVPGSYPLIGGGVNIIEPTYSAFYFAGEEGYDCATCGGSMTLESYEEEQSMSGSATLTMLRLLPEPDGDEMPTVTMDVDFVAAFGSQYQGTSPYVRCSIQYGD